jgi:hypothetical protein
VRGVLNLPDVPADDRRDSVSSPARGGSRPAPEYQDSKAFERARELDRQEQERRERHARRRAAIAATPARRDRGAVVPFRTPRRRGGRGFREESKTGQEGPETTIGRNDARTKPAAIAAAAAAGGKRVRQLLDRQQRGIMRGLSRDRIEVEGLEPPSENDAEEERRGDGIPSPERGGKRRRSDKEAVRSGGRILREEGARAGKYWPWSR